MSSHRGVTKMGEIQTLGNMTNTDLKYSNKKKTTSFQDINNLFKAVQELPELSDDEKEIRAKTELLGLIFPSVKTMYEKGFSAMRIADFINEHISFRVSKKEIAQIISKITAQKEDANQRKKRNYVRRKYQKNSENITDNSISLNQPIEDNCIDESQNQIDKVTINEQPNITKSMTLESDETNENVVNETDESYAKYTANNAPHTARNIRGNFKIREDSEL
jgi:hypothetical protein